MADRINRKRLFLLLIILGLVIAAGIYVFLMIFNPGESPWEREAAVSAVPPAPEPSPPKPVESRQMILRGSSLEEILTRRGFSRVEVHRLKEQVKPVYDMGRIQAGRELRFFHDVAGEITGFEYPIEQNKFLVVGREGPDFKATIREIPYVVETAVLCGRTGGNLTAAFTDLKEMEILAYEFSDLFGWDIDFNTDQRPEDTFRIVFEKRYLEGKFIGYGSIPAAEFTNQGKTLQAFLFAYPDTKASGHYDAAGNSLKKEFLKSPISYARITSRFSMRRLHPIRKIVRPHFGVDYAAAVGTPVQATADGTVISAGWNGASGRMVSLRHRNGYQTLYLHLSRFAAGIRSGVRVSSGQVIGYVGSSGESTGAHLDYRIKLNGSYVNPLSHKFSPVEPLRKEYLGDFQKVVAQYVLALDSPFELLRRLTY